MAEPAIEPGAIYFAPFQPPKWEYMVWDHYEAIFSAVELMTELDARGRDGWELCSSIGARYIFKRQVVE